jgi:hypothetical protein
MGNNSYCIPLCERDYSPTIEENLRYFADHYYGFRLMVDDLVSATRFVTELEGGADSGSDEFIETIDYQSSIPVAVYNDTTDELVYNNHFDIFVTTHKTSDGTYRVVAFDIEPRSIAWGSNPCDASTRRPGV